MKSEYNFKSIDGTKSVEEIHSIMNKEVQKYLIQEFYTSKYPIYIPDCYVIK